MQDYVLFQRLFVGYDIVILVLVWYFNGMYVFLVLDEMDKLICMWFVIIGLCVRVFIGYIDYVSVIECVLNGNILVSVDCVGNIFFWDLNKGIRIKWLWGYGKGGIWLLSFSVEFNVLVLGGQDGMVCLWDVELLVDF